MEKSQELDILYNNVSNQIFEAVRVELERLLRNIDKKELCLFTFPDNGFYEHIEDLAFFDLKATLIMSKGYTEDNLIDISGWCTNGGNLNDLLFVLRDLEKIKS